MRRRILSTIGLWFLLMFFIGLGGKFGGQLLLIAVAAGVTFELANLLRKIHLQVNSAAMMLAVVVALAGHFFGSASIASIFTSIALILILASHWKESPATLCGALGGVLVCSIGLGSLNALTSLDSLLLQKDSQLPIWWTIWLIAVIKLSDAGAYLFGTQLGKKALAPLISPGKTVEGFFGALLSGFIIGSLGAPLFINPYLGPILGVILAFFGTIGDLLESFLKRTANVKDSGKLIPGIGGLLDLCDSLIVAAPVGYLAILFFNKV